MRSSFTATTGLPLAKAPSLRERARRRWILAIAAMLTLAGGAALVGALTAEDGSRMPAASTGPFSYFPSE